uniref:Uncharacterized protein n=1 Tax=Pithovirus LCPAC202 TaxID=2506592 RepID=A0A481Z5D8_9VIRU|nr:MAG: hypothetical protein LCPAC202_00870 [Pithovirus LCPAC202]
MDHRSKYILNYPEQTGITDPRGMVKITSRDLEEMISFLANNHHFYPEKLSNDDPVLSKLNMFKTTISYLRGKEDYDLLYEIINRQYRPSIIKDETIGAFLFGCMQQDYGDIDRGCAISCLNSFNPDHQPLICSYQLWVQENINPEDGDIRFKLFHDGINTSQYPENNFQSIGYVLPDRPSRAIIYINLDFDGFRGNELQFFEDNGVIMAELMIKDGSRYKRVHPLTLLEKLPQINKGRKSQPFQYKSGKDFTKNNFGGVTSSILSEDGVYVPFVTAYKGHNDHSLAEPSEDSEFDDILQYNTNKHNNQQFGFNKTIPLFWMILIVILIIIIIAGLWFFLSPRKNNQRWTNRPE